MLCAESASVFSPSILNISAPLGLVFLPTYSPNSYASPKPINLLSLDTMATHYVTPSNRNLAPPNPAPADPERHARKCAICRHKDRHAIDAAFIHWHRPARLAGVFNIKERGIYRHAHALSLFAARRKRIPHAVQFLIKCSATEPRPADILRATLIHACASSPGRYLNPPRPRTVEVSQIVAAQSRMNAPLIDSRKTSKSPVTPTKQTPAQSSNREKNTTCSAGLPRTAAKGVSPASYDLVNVGADTQRRTHPIIGTVALASRRHPTTASASQCENHRRTYPFATGPKNDRTYYNQPRGKPSGTDR